MKGWGQLPSGLASPRQAPTGLRGSPAWPWPGAKSPEAQGRGQEGGGRYHPERQLLALIYFCFKCWRIAGLEPPARGARAAAGRRGRWGLHSPSLTSLALSLSASPSDTRTHTHSHSSAPPHLHTLPPPGPALLSQSPKEASGDREARPLPPTLLLRSCCTSGWGCPSLGLGWPTPTAGMSYCTLSLGHPLAQRGQVRGWRQSQAISR